MTKWQKLTAQSFGEILDWAANQSWVQEMAACQQDAIWHAEGDVWTHTKLVCGELERLAEWSDLDRPQQLKLFFTALFHDSGKPATTCIDPETGRTRSHGHAAVGVAVARRVLRELDCDFATREAICNLVAYHGRPPYLLEKSSPELEVIRLSWMVENRLLYLFALADTRGRLAREMSRSEDTLHMWKLACEEQTCFDQPYPFANDHARFLFFRQQLSHPTYAPHESYRCTMTLMSGLPGAGKDTWLARTRPGLPVVSLDEIRDGLEIDPTDKQGEVIQAAREQCRIHLRAGRDFSFNATNVSKQLRQRWIDLAHDYQARAEIVYCEPPLAIVLAQNKRRPEPVPDKVILSLCERVEPPSITECHQLSVV